jgi:hypothetical protein
MNEAECERPALGPFRLHTKNAKIERMRHRDPHQAVVCLDFPIIDHVPAAKMMKKW